MDDELLQCLKILSYTVPMHGNPRTIPYGAMLVKDSAGTGTVKFGKIDELGRTYVTFRRRRHYYRNTGDLYHPSLIFYHPQ